MTDDPATGLLPMLILLASALAALARWRWVPAWRARRLAALQARPFPTAWRHILRQRVPLVARLPADLQQRLKGLVQVFLADKAFIGCQGQAIDDEVRVTIAAQACLLLLGQPAAHDAHGLYPGLRQVLVYPAPFVVDRVQPLGAGLQQDQRQVLSGESWQQGQVILSWPDVLAGAADPSDGENLVLHEFAHQIDQDSGVADGRPWRASRADRQRWDAVMGEAFNRLQWQPSALLGSYAATSPAEFLAVATERFFERPQALADEWPEVYQQLAALYRVHPLVW